MKNILFRYILSLSIGLLGYVSYGQEYNNFEVRYQNNLRGDLTFIGNNILNRDSGTAGERPNDAYNNQINADTGGTNNDSSGFFNFNDFINNSVTCYSNFTFITYHLLLVYSNF